MRKGEIKTLPPRRGTRALLPRYHPVWQCHHSAQIGDNGLPALSTTTIAAPRITDGESGQVYLDIGCQRSDVGLRQNCLNSDLRFLTSEFPFGCQLWEDIRRALRIRLAPTPGLAETNCCAYSFPSSPLGAIMPQEIGVVNLFAGPITRAPCVCGHPLLGHRAIASCRRAIAALIHSMQSGSCHTTRG